MEDGEGMTRRLLAGAVGWGTGRAEGACGLAQSLASLPLLAASPTRRTYQMAAFPSHPCLPCQPTEFAVVTKVGYNRLVKAQMARSMAARVEALQVGAGKGANRKAAKGSGAVGETVAVSAVSRGCRRAGRETGAALRCCSAYAPAHPSLSLCLLPLIRTPSPWP